MNAYYLAMLFIFLNIGVYMVANLGVFSDDLLAETTIGSFFYEKDFGDKLSEKGNEQGLSSKLLNFLPLISVGALALALVLASARIFDTQAVTPEGIAYAGFAIIFWVPFGLTLDLFNTISTRFPGFGIFTGIFFAIGSLIFCMGLIQLVTGGVKAHG